MKFLVSDEHWDINGYQKYLETLGYRFDEQTFKFIVADSFHDGYIKHMELINHFEKGEEEIEDPTTIRMVVQHCLGGLYEVMWHKVRRFFFDYDITRNVYSNLNEIVAGGNRGIDEWGYDEILVVGDTYLSHEIDLFSRTKIIIHCRDITIRVLP